MSGLGDLITLADAAHLGGTDIPGVRKLILAGTLEVAGEFYPRTGRPESLVRRRDVERWLRDRAG